MNINVHPAPGFGELLPGFFVVPHNPITPVSRVPRIGELVAAKFSIPENPLTRALVGDNGLQPQGSRSVSMSAIGSCGCIGSMCGQGCEGLGMGQLPGGLEAVSGFLPWILGGAVVLWMLSRPGGRAYHQERARAESEYQSKVSGIKARHKGYKRVARSASTAVQRGLQAATA
jgi:hypothetical protein